jgi:hypothetical protein
MLSAGLVAEGRVRPAAQDRSQPKALHREIGTSNRKYAGPYRVQASFGDSMPYCIGSETKLDELAPRNDPMLLPGQSPCGAIPSLKR